MAVSDTLLNTLFDGRYRIMRKLGTGGMANVYLAEDQELGRRVAINYARQILAAVRFGHRHGIIHRDIKPHNVLVDAEGRLKVTDFGIARAGGSQMTEAGSIIGTAQYLSPEQAKGAPVDQTSDLYSVGVVLYELLTGVVPFTGDTPVEIAMKHLSTVPEPPSSRRAEIPRDLDMIVLRALAKDPAERYQSADEMDADLARVQRGAAVSPATEQAATAIISRPVVTPPLTAVTQLRQNIPYAPPAAYYDYDEPRRRAFWPWLLALLFVGAAVVGGYFLYHEIQNQISGGTVGVERYEGLREIDADKKIRAIGLVPNVVRQP